jgi:hypothetical protein
VDGYAGWDAWRVVGLEMGREYEAGWLDWPKEKLRIDLEIEAKGPGGQRGLERGGGGSCEADWIEIAKNTRRVGGGPASVTAHSRRRPQPGVPKHEARQRNSPKNGGE